MSAIAQSVAIGIGYIRKSNERPVKRGKTRYDNIALRKYKIGQRVVGVRDPMARHGVLVDAYVTLNNGYRNPAYVVRCDCDGKDRVFQGLRSEDHKFNRGYWDEK